MKLRTLATGALGMALAASPLLASAHDDEKTNVLPALDKTAVSIGISNDGSVLVRGAKVTSVANDKITAETSVKGVTLTWHVAIDNGTDYVKMSGSSMQESDIRDGDYVSFSGTLTGSNLSEVSADVVRDWSLDDSAMAPRFSWYHLDQWPVFSFFAHARAGANTNAK